MESIDTKFAQRGGQMAKKSQFEMVKGGIALARHMEHKILRIAMKLRGLGFQASAVLPSWHVLSIGGSWSLNLLRPRRDARSEREGGRRVGDT